MPVSLTMIDSVVRVIGDIADSEADKGQRRGVKGSGFLCAVPSRNLPGYRYGYVVTAHHVIDGQNRPEVQAPIPHSRGMELQDPVDVLNWIQPLDNVDLAIADFGGGHGGRYGGLETNRLFLPPHIAPSLGNPITYIGILEPEDRVMARSGTIGALDQIGMSHPGGYEYPAHLADCRTHGGFSGSPVFAEFEFPVFEVFDESKLPPMSREPGDTAPRGTVDFCSWLCGMLTWHLADTRGEMHASLYGVVAVLPHTQIWSGLMELQDDRDAADEVNAARTKEPKPTNISTAGEGEESEFEKFESLARQLVNTPKPKSQPE